MEVNSYQQMFGYIIQIIFFCVLQKERKKKKKKKEKEKMCVDV